MLKSKRERQEEQHISTVLKKVHLSSKSEQDQGKCDEVHASDDPSSDGDDFEDIIKVYEQVEPQEIGEFDSELEFLVNEIALQDEREVPVIQRKHMPYIV